MANEENLKPFKKGHDPRRNTKGRPKGVKNRTTIVKKWLEVSEETQNPITKETENLSQEDIIVLATINQARKGNVHAFKELMDSVYGKIEDNVKLDLDAPPVSFIELARPQDSDASEEEPDLDD